MSPFLVYGGWNLIAIAGSSPETLVDPYLFVRSAPAPERIKPAHAPQRPEGAFLLLGRQVTGQGVSLPFVQGVAEGDHRRTNRAAGPEQEFIYFAVADQFIRGGPTPVEIEVEYLDKGTDPFALDYDSTDKAAPVDGAFKSAPQAVRTDTGEWRTHVFVLPDARFENREHLGSDFRVYGIGDDLAIRRIEVRRAR